MVRMRAVHILINPYKLTIVIILAFFLLPVFPIGGPAAGVLGAADAVYAAAGNPDDPAFFDEYYADANRSETRPYTPSLSATAVADGGARRVELTWSNRGGLASSYEIWRHDEQFPGWKPLDTAVRGSAGYSDERVGAGERYMYRIRARSAENDSLSRFSNTAEATTVFSEAPSHLAWAAASNSTATLTWRDNSANESRFVIDRRYGAAGQWTYAAQTAANVTERQGLNAPANAAVYYRVGAYSQTYNSISYGEPVLVDYNGNVFIRGSSYKNDNNIAAAGAGSAAGNGASGKDNRNGGAPGGANAAKTIRIAGRAATDGGDLITRGEFVAMLVRSLRIEEKPIGSFADVRRDHPFYDEIMQAARLGFIRADINNLFYPDRILTREEMAVFVYDCSIAVGRPLPPRGADALQAFPDADGVPARCLPQARAVFGEQIMIGIGTPANGNYIGIDRDATLDQAALVIDRYAQWLEGYENAY